MVSEAHRRGRVTGLVLAGGLARRMQLEPESAGAKANLPALDKGLVELHGRPMVAYAVERLAPQVDALLINANRNLEAYGRFGVPVIEDRVGGFAGPLAGLHAGLAAAETEWLVTVPCDSPYFPDDLVSRLQDAAQTAGADVAVAKTGSQPHPVFALVRGRLLDSLGDFLSAGGRKIDRWYAPLAVVEVPFADEHAFDNINTQQELATSGRPDTVSDAKKSERRIGLPSASIAAACAAEPGYDARALPVASAKAIIDRVVRPVDAIESVALTDCLGRTLASDVVSPVDVPPHDNSAMDGYALRHADLAADAETRLEVVGSAFAGVPSDRTLGPGEALRIMTGAVMPGGADTVVPQELARAVSRTDRQGNHLDDGTPAVVIPPGQQSGQHRRLRGEDLALGMPALRAGRRLTPADVGLAASLGLTTLAVRRRIRVAYFSTGDELLAPGDTPVPGKVYDSNRYTIGAMLARLGAESIDLGIVPDNPEALEQAMRRAASLADAVVSSGGVSVGEADFTREVMARVGEVAFWTIAMRPGRPMAFGRIGAGVAASAIDEVTGDALYFGLPGNPVAVMVTFYFFVRDALDRLSGAERRELAPIRVRSARAVRKRPGRTEYQRAILAAGSDGFLEAQVNGSQGSGVLRSMSEADCMMVLAHDQGDVAAGDWVDVIPFHALV